VTFTCARCGWLVAPRAIPGRWRELRKGIRVPIPADLPLHTCLACGETYETPAETAALDVIQEAMIRQRKRAAMDRVVRDHRELLLVLARR
jgi:hypothetical protein